MKYVEGQKVLYVVGWLGVVHLMEGLGSEDGGDPVLPCIIHLRLIYAIACFRAFNPMIWGGVLSIRT